MDEARKLLRREAERVTAPPDPVPRIMHRLARRRRRRRAAAAVTALVVAGTGIAVAYTAFSGGRSRPASEPASPPFPGAFREGGNMIMPIAFLNGTTAEMVYPAHLALEDVRIQPAGSLYAGVPDFQIGRLHSKFVVRYEPLEDLTPVESYEPPQNGIVRRWGAEPTTDFQTFRLGPWLVEVGYVELNDEQRVLFLQHLFGLETEGGFLILDATPPLQLWEEELVAQFYFDVDDLTLMDRCIDLSQSADDTFERNGMTIYRVIEGADMGVDYLSWCDRTGQFAVGIREGPTADALIEGLSFRETRRVEAVSGSVKVVPNVVGLAARDAREVLESVPFTIEVAIRANSDQPSGLVLDQRPAAGAAVDPDTVVRLVVAA